MQMDWVYHPTIPSIERLIFNNAMLRHIDQYYYAPIAMAKREESGVKYRFLCIAALKNINNTPSHFADIEVYKPIFGMPYISGLYKIEFDKLFPHRMPI